MQVSVDAPTRVIGREHKVLPDGTRVHLRQCPLCECMCGMEIHLDPDDKVKVIRPDKDDVWSKGYICPKGTTLGKLHEDPDRIRTPMIRDGETWREATWDEAFARCEELIHGVRERYGTEAMTAFIGNPAGHSFSIGRYGALLMGQAGFPCIYSAGTVDQWPKNVSCVLMYGNMWKIPTVDVRRTDYWVIMGGNPQASGGSLLGCPDVLGEIDAIQERGGKVVVIDPRRTGTADRAVEWLPIRPGHRRRLPAGAVQRDLRRGPPRPRPDRRHGQRRRRGARRRRRLHARVRRRLLPDPGRDHPPHRPRASPPPSGAPSTAASACATRSSAPSPPGSSTSSTSSPATSTSRAG